MMVPKQSEEQGREIDCYFDSRPKVTTARNTNPAIDQVEVQKMRHFVRGYGICTDCGKEALLFTRVSETEDVQRCLKCLDRNHAVTVEEWLTL